MAISINTNMNALLARRTLSSFGSQSTNMIERLSSGIRINSAADDAANLSLSKKIDSTNRGLNVANNNIQIGITKLQTFDGYLGGIADSLINLRNLSIQSANGTHEDSQRAMLDTESQQLMNDIKNATSEANKNITANKSEGTIRLSESEAIAQGYTVITTADELKTIDTTDLNGKYILMNDIDMSGFSENNSVINGTFTGEFNGNGNSIKNLTINGGASDNIGLISITQGATIKNLTLNNINISGENMVGGIGGSINDSKISNVHVSGIVNGNSGIGMVAGVTFSNTIIDHSSSSGTINGDTYIGGLVGANLDTTVKNSSSTATVSGDDYLGGLLGSNYTATSIVENSYATGNVTGNQEEAGGLVGTNYGTIEGSYATGTVSASTHAGGLVGLNKDTGKIVTSYATGNVYGTDDDINGLNHAGGFVGYNNGAIADSYATGDVFGEAGVGGFIGLNDTTFAVTNSYASGKVSSTALDITGHNSAGGLVGRNLKGDISGSFATGEISSTKDKGGLVGYLINGNIDDTNYWAEDSTTATTAKGYQSGGTISAQQTDKLTLMSGGGPVGNWDTDIWRTSGGLPQLKTDCKEFSLQIGDGTSNNSNFDMKDLAINLNFDIDLSTIDGSKSSIEVLDMAINYLSEKRATLGTQINGLENILQGNVSRSNSLTESASTIRDTDMGYEAANLAKNQIITQSAMSILQQAQNINGNIILSLY